MDRDGADNSWLGARGTGTDLERAAIGIRSNSVTGVVDKIYLATSSANRLIIDSIGNVGIGVVMPGQKLDVAGNISASGNITAAAYLYTSDARLKKEITPLSNSLENILDIQGVHFLWRNPHIENAKALQIGLIAQQVRKVFPEVVVEGLDGKLQVNYPVLIAPIIEAIRSLYERIVSNQQQVEDLKKTVTLLQMDNYELAKRLDVLEQKISNLKRK